MKYSKQRELILNFVKNSDEHPSADTIYLHVKKQIPNISLGTVYRNLNQLCENRLLRKIAMSKSSDRFDKIIDDHCHFYCESCQLIIDIDKKVVDEINNLIENKTRHTVVSNDIVLTGICHNCKNKN